MSEKGSDPFTADERGYVDQCFTRGPGAGVHQAVLAFLGLMRRHHWRLPLDVAAYFPSVDLDRLEALLFRRLRDPDTRRLVTRLLDTGARVYRTAQARVILGPPRPGRRGLPLGSYLSQWCGNFYLDGLDHYVKPRCVQPASPGPRAQIPPTRTRESGAADHSRVRAFPGCIDFRCMRRLMDCHRHATPSHPPSGGLRQPRG